MPHQEPDTARDGAAYFGHEVLKFRKQRGMTQQELATDAGYERPYVTRVEGGTLLASMHFAEACDRVFGTPEMFARLRQRVAERGHPGWFIRYATIEQEAKCILDSSPVVIPGILQTREYATAIFRQAHPRENAESIAERVEARLARRAVLTRPNPPLLWVVIHEAALRMVMGSKEIMASQLASLLADEAASPHVTIQVLPFAQGLPAGASLFILVTPEKGPTLLYTETMTTGHVDDSAATVAEAQDRYDRLRAAALPPEESLAFIRQVMEEYEQ
ncbi:helix-turn-helix transcriptional regulator [Streptomyces sp. NPDC021020]|uniref:helix-turn-helix transcriptional regulator n=1 Tax=Streptomyces sp. NPDC021020 TaxID=3365109 RepID=UPI00378A9BA7